jgi:hypothetical protein
MKTKPHQNRHARLIRRTRRCWQCQGKASRGYCVECGMCLEPF